MELNIVLYEPEIPQNTGNIARTCVGFNAILHLIKPYGFILSDSKLKRSGVDYWNKLKLKEYDCWIDFWKTLSKKDQIYFVTRYGKNNLSSIKKINHQNKVYLIFGKESTGIPKQILLKNRLRCIRIPTSKNVRALNLSNCVAICAYHIAWLNNFKNLSKQEPHKINYFNNKFV